MRVLITGAAGMIGAKLAASILQSGDLGGNPVSHLDLVDIVAPAVIGNNAITVTNQQADLSNAGAITRLIDQRPDVVVHLAAMPSGGAEREFETGYAINLTGMRALVEAIRLQGLRAPYCPRVIFSSSIAVFGGPFPDKIGDDFLTMPLTSYGAQKVMGEMLLCDYSRRGFLDGIALRLPTICIRPGAPNKAASGFFSNILREPLVGKAANLPVSPDVRHWFASPRSSVGFIHHAGALDLSRLGPRRALNMPGLCATVQEEIEALERVAGKDATKRITRIPEPEIATIVDGWAQDFETTRANALGFTADASFDDIIHAHIEDELG